MLKTQIIGFPRRRPPQISSEEWRSFIEKRRTLIEMRGILQNLERAWEAERDWLLALVVDGAEIERDE